MQGSHVQHTEGLKWSSLWLGLELDAQPAMTLIPLAEGTGHHCVGKCEEAGVVPSLLAESEGALQILAVQHGLYSLPCHIPAQHVARLWQKPLSGSSHDKEFLA